VSASFIWAQRSVLGMLDFWALAASGGATGPRGWTPAFLRKRPRWADGEEPMTDKTIDLDKRRGMSAQKETKLRRLHRQGDRIA